MPYKKIEDALNEDVSVFYDAYTIEEAYNILNEDEVKEPKIVSANFAQGFVNDKRRYFVTFATVNGSFFSNCSCHKIGFCKHSCALFLGLKEKNKPVITLKQEKQEKALEGLEVDAKVYQDLFNKLTLGKGGNFYLKEATIDAYSRNLLYAQKKLKEYDKDSIQYKEMLFAILLSLLRTRPVYEYQYYIHTFSVSFIFDYFNDIMFYMKDFIYFVRRNTNHLWLSYLVFLYNYISNNVFLFMLNDVQLEGYQCLMAEIIDGYNKGNHEDVMPKYEFDNFKLDYMYFLLYYDGIGKLSFEKITFDSKKEKEEQFEKSRKESKILLDLNVATKNGDFKRYYDILDTEENLLRSKTGLGMMIPYLRNLIHHNCTEQASQYLNYEIAPIAPDSPFTAVNILDEFSDILDNTAIYFFCGALEQNKHILLSKIIEYDERLTYIYDNLQNYKNVIMYLKTGDRFSIEEANLVLNAMIFYYLRKETKKSNDFEVMKELTKELATYPNGYYNVFDLLTKVDNIHEYNSYGWEFTRFLRRLEVDLRRKV